MVGFSSKRVTAAPACTGVEVFAYDAFQTELHDAASTVAGSVLVHVVESRLCGQFRSKRYPESGGICLAGEILAAERRTSNTKNGPAPSQEFDRRSAVLRHLRCNRRNEGTPASSSATISPSRTNRWPQSAGAAPISGKVRVMSAPLRLRILTEPPSTTAMPRWPSNLASTAHPSNGVGGLPCVTSVGFRRSAFGLVAAWVTPALIAGRFVFAQAFDRVLELIR